MDDVPGPSFEHMDTDDTSNYTVPPTMTPAERQRLRRLNMSIQQRAIERSRDRQRHSNETGEQHNVQLCSECSLTSL